AAPLPPLSVFFEVSTIQAFAENRLRTPRTRTENARGTAPHPALMGAQKWPRAPSQAGPTTSAALGAGSAGFPLGRAIQITAPAPIAAMPVKSAMSAIV